MTLTTVSDPDCFSPEDVMEDTEFEIDIKRHIYLVPVAGNILDALREKAKAEGLSTETLINILLQKQTLEGKQEAKRS